LRDTMSLQLQKAPRVRSRFLGRIQDFGGRRWW
jgi:hypothetical protein